MGPMTPDLRSSPPRPVPTAPAPAAFGPAPAGALRRSSPAGHPGLLRVQAWEDPGVDPWGHDPRGTYVERFWLPVVGPSGLWLVRRLAGLLDADPSGFDLDPLDTAHRLGIGGPDSRRAPLDRALSRAERFGLLRRPLPGLIEVRRRLASVPAYRVARFPAGLRAEHERWQAEARAGGVRTATFPAPPDPVNAPGCPGELERMLLDVGVHPALAHQAALQAQRARSGPAQPTEPPGPSPSRRLHALPGLAGVRPADQPASSSQMTWA